MPPCFCTPCTFVCPPGCTPPCSQCSCMVLEHCMLWGVVFLLNVYWGTPPLFGGASPLSPTLLCWLPVHCYSQGYQFLCGGLSPSIEGFGGVFPHHLGRFGGTSALCYSHVHSYTFFLCIMSHVSTTALTTTPPVTVVSSGLSSVSVAPSLTGFPGSHGVVPPPPLMLRSSGSVLGSASVPQQHIPSSMPPLAYANYAMGSPQVGFFFRVELPPFCILYMFGVCSGVCFLF